MAAGSGPDRFGNGILPGSGPPHRFALPQKRILMPSRQRIRLNGIVQGVGFRPFVYRLARDLGLAGFVRNSSDGVAIEVQGAPGRLRSFRDKLMGEPPPLAQIVDFAVEDLAPGPETEFTIDATLRESTPTTLVSPDISVCDACLGELADPDDRRHRYPFINCTNCGPRYTITRAIPYDRPNTSMAVFPLCPQCRAEYDNPGDRRFHAQPNACDRCGPRPSYHLRDGVRLDTRDPIAAAGAALRAGNIVAVRGTGGFHLAADPRQDAVVRELRRRKGRSHKPFALMAADLRVIRRYCRVSAAEENELRGPRRPIVLLRTRPGCDLAATVAPGNLYLGFMLPYTPLHELLLQTGFDTLVMTSGNLSEEPIAIGNDEALRRLAGLADGFLLHDRKIVQRCDDSILRVVGGRPRLLRRSRGWVPGPIRLPSTAGRSILACGGELKNTIALSRGDMAFLSQHIGDLDNPSALEFFENSIDHLQAILEIRPEAIAHDLHPDYLSTRWAVARDDLPLVGVQHHHAHLAAVMAENGVTEPTIGLLLDGTGYGTDGTIWGGEVLVGNFTGFERHAWLRPLPMPGGEAAIREPWRMAVAALRTAFGRETDGLAAEILNIPDRERIAFISQMIDRGVNSPRTSSCGRLFDAVAALCGLRSRVEYEAQAAIELEMAVEESETGCYEDSTGQKDGDGPIDTAPLIRAVVTDRDRGTPVPRIAARFHNTLARIFLNAARAARDRHGIERVALSGGVFQNVRFLSLMIASLVDHRFEVLTHRQVPTNDGGLSLGQLVIADARLRQAGGDLHGAPKRTSGGK
jgi:hydrogenase maturation protein HypF